VRRKAYTLLSWLALDWFWNPFLLYGEFGMMIFGPKEGLHAIFLLGVELVLCTPHIVSLT